MTGMTTDQRRTLVESIKQFGDSQARIQAEQDHQAALAAMLKDSHGIEPKHFRRVAMAHWKDEVAKQRGDAEAQLDLFELVRGMNVVAMREVEDG